MFALLTVTVFGSVAANHEYPACTMPRARTRLRSSTSMCDQGLPHKLDFATALSSVRRRYRRQLPAARVQFNLECKIIKLHSNLRIIFRCVQLFGPLARSQVESNPVRALPAAVLGPTALRLARHAHA